MRLHLLDGTYELFRSHYGRKDTVTGPDGADLKATLGIMESTLALLREPGVTHLGASFDTVIESFRNVMFPAYKSSAGMDPDLLAQFPIAETALEAIGVVVWRNIEFEADDAIATAAIRWVEDVDQVVIATPDKDLNQLVIGEQIVTYNRREQKLLDEAAVVEKFGIHPESIPDYLALVGDTADGVPGLPGWGAKSAATVLWRYPRLELIPESAADWEVTVRSGGQAGRRPPGEPGGRASLPRAHHTSSGRADRRVAGRSRVDGRAPLPNSKTSAPLSDSTPSRSGFTAGLNDNPEVVSTRGGTDQTV